MLMMQYCIPRNFKAQIKIYNKLVCPWEFQSKRSFMKNWEISITISFYRVKISFLIVGLHPLPSENILEIGAKDGGKWQYFWITSIFWWHSPPECKFPKGKNCVCLLYYISLLPRAGLAHSECYWMNVSIWKLYWRGISKLWDNVLKTWVLQREFYLCE